MRSVRIVVRQMAGSVPLLVAASALVASGCEESSSTQATGTSEGGGTVAVDSAGSSASLPYGCSSYGLPLPSGGQPAALGDICAVEAEPVLSSAAARIALAPPGSNPQAAVVATLTFAAELREKVRGAPVVEVIAASNYMLQGAQLSPPEQTADGYTFTVTWPAGVLMRAGDMTRVSFRTAFDVACDSGVRLVNAVTEAHLCGGELSPSAWVSSGDMCVVCYENQPSPGAKIPKLKGVFDSKVEGS
jgi:hypothetical protein